MFRVYLSNKKKLVFFVHSYRIGMKSICLKFLVDILDIFYKNSLKVTSTVPIWDFTNVNI